MFFDPLYILLSLPGLIIALIAELMVKGTFAKYNNVAASSGLTGAEAAERLLRDADIYDVTIEKTYGFLSDHYDPTAKVLRLSPGVYESNSLSAIGVACHEAGHAIQHKECYAPLSLRSALVPIAQFASPASYFLFILGFLFRSQNLILFGVILFAAAVLFSIITLPVEYNASSRAKRLMQSAGIVNSYEANSAGAVLNAAFMTYVASAINSLLILLYYMIRAGLFSRRD